MIEPVEPSPTAQEMISLHAYARVYKTQPPVTPLRSQHEKLLQHLLKAIQQGNHAAVEKHSQFLYKEVFEPTKVIHAYFQIQDLGVDKKYGIFHIIMGFLQQIYGQQRPLQLHRTSLEDSLVYLLLALARSAGKVVSYTYQDPEDSIEKHRYFAVTPNSIQKFLSPFDIDKQKLIQQTIVIQQDKIFGFPAGRIKHQHDEKVSHYQAERKRYKAFLHKQSTQIASPSTPTPSEQKSIKRPAFQTTVQQKLLKTSLSENLSALSQYCQTPEEKAAFDWISEPTQAEQLERIIHKPLSVFEEQLKNLYSQKLNPRDAKRLASRMAVMFQGILKKIYEEQGKRFWEVWSKYQKEVTGKKNYTATVYGTEESPLDKIKTYFENEAKSQDKQEGKQTLLDFYSEQNKEAKKEDESFTKDHRRVLAALSDTETLSALCHFSVPEALWSQLPESLQTILFGLFERFCQQNMSIIKDKWLAYGTEHDMFSCTKDVFTHLERGFLDVVKRLDLRSIPEIIETLEKEKAHYERLQKQKTPEYERSVAGAYAKYQQS